MDDELELSCQLYGYKDGKDIVSNFLESRGMLRPLLPFFNTRLPGIPPPAL
jgi:hypothetical protein